MKCPPSLANPAHDHDDHTHTHTHFTSMSVLKKGSSVWFRFSCGFIAPHDSPSVWCLCFGHCNSDLRRQTEWWNQSYWSVVWHKWRFLCVCVCLCVCSLHCLCFRCRVLGCWVWPGRTVTRVIRFTRLSFFSHERRARSVSPPLPASFPFSKSLSRTHTLVPELW